MNTKEEQMREFEAWAAPLNVTLPLKRDESGLYVYASDRTNAALMAWQAALNSLEGKSVLELDDDEQTVATSDRGMLNYLMQAFEGESWQCERCGHSEDCKTMDSAKFLKDYLDRFPQPPQETIAVSVDMSLCHYEHIVVDDSEESDAGVWPVLVPNGFKIVPAIAEDRVRELEKDAARYRWLREHYYGFESYRSGVIPYVSLDSEVDKNIAAMKEPNTSEDSNKLKGEG